MPNRSSKVINYLFENSLFLIFGAIAGLIWANLDAITGAHGYHGLVHLKLWVNDFIGAVKSVDGEMRNVVDMHYLVNDVLMAFFFAIAGKEVWEATLPGGPLSNPRKAATPLLYRNVVMEKASN